MLLDLYQAETERITAEQTALLDEAREVLKSVRKLSAFEGNGVLHALQILIENSLCKAKQWLKTKEAPVPVFAYDAFATLDRVGLIALDDLSNWDALVGIRDRIVHDYMSIDLGRIHALVLDGRLALGRFAEQIVLQLSARGVLSPT